MADANFNFTRFCTSNKRSLCIFSVIGGLYTYALATGKTHPNEAYRLALAGSAASLVGECLGHVIDTVSTRAKYHHTSITSSQMAK